MMIKNKINYVADGIMGFITAMRNDHHVSELELLERVRDLLEVKINTLKALDPSRNR